MTKPDNLLLSGSIGAFPHVVVADFGQASAALLSGRVVGPPGDPRYCPPEAWDGDAWMSISKPGDVWMLACILFEMLSGGVSPFLDRPYSLEEFQTVVEPQQWQIRLKTVEPNWAATRVGAIPRSAAVLDLCAKMLMKRVYQRPDCPACAEHQWFQEQQTVEQLGKSEGQRLVAEARARIVAGLNDPNATAGAANTLASGSELPQAEEEDTTRGQRIAAEARARILAAGITQQAKQSEEPLRLSP